MNIVNIPNKITSFLKEVKLEMKKVNWPTREETIRYTLIIVSISAIVAIYLGGLDILFTALLEKFIF
jgi:preprotein translocase subunit SecE